MALSREEIADVILSMREERGLSLDDVANATGLNRVSLWNWETARNLPGCEALFKLCEFYKVSVDESFDLQVSKRERVIPSAKPSSYKYTITAAPSYSRR